MLKKYFLYRHIRLDKNEPFYIGIGINNRRTTRTRLYERAYKKDGRNQQWRNIAALSGYSVDIMYETDDKQEIVSKESEFIKLYGRRDLGLGPLVNFTNGGEGQFELSEESRNKISKSMIGNKRSLGKKMSDEFKKEVSERFKGNTNWRGRTHKQSSKELIAEARTGVSLSESHVKSLFNTKPNARKIVCLTNGIVYDSICDCVRRLFNMEGVCKGNKFRNVKYKISHVCNGKKENYRGYKFKFLENA